MLQSFQSSRFFSEILGVSCWIVYIILYIYFSGAQCRCSARTITGMHFFHTAEGPADPWNLKFLADTKGGWKGLHVVLSCQMWGWASKIWPTPHHERYESDESRIMSHTGHVQQCKKTPSKSKKSLARPSKSKQSCSYKSPGWSSK